MKFALFSSVSVLFICFGNIEFMSYLIKARLEMYDSGWQEDALTKGIKS